MLGNNLIEVILEEIISPENIVLLLNDPDKYKNMLKKEINNPNKNKKEKQNIKNKNTTAPSARVRNHKKREGL